ncbi:hypothetical protein, partial [Staphylococcus aureus]|uniref:hypothetical protein n=1 Tax=Staphylococcus aureus TaxID=1280 RepID=UPI001C2E923A
TCNRQRFDELSAKPRLFETRIFYAAPQASADAFPPIDPVQAHVAHCAGCETCDGWREMLGSQRQASEEARKSV